MQLADAVLVYVKEFPNATIIRTDGVAPSATAIARIVKKLDSPFAILNVRDCGNHFSKSQYHLAVTKNGMALAYFLERRDAEQYVVALEATL